MEKVEHDYYFKKQNYIFKKYHELLELFERVLASQNFHLIYLLSESLTFFKTQSQYLKNMKQKYQYLNSLPKIQQGQ